MKFRTLGRSSLEVSEVGLGCNNFGRTVAAAQTARIVHAALDNGVNFFDTADLYGKGESEKFLGKALAHRRHEAIIATKFGWPLEGDERRGGGSRRWIMEAVTDSLRRLNTDYIDLYQFHRPDPCTPIDETLRVLDDLVSSGKVRFIGHCNFDRAQIAEADAKAAILGAPCFVATQAEYSLLNREAAGELLLECGQRDLGFLPYFPLASGLLTGKYREGEAPPSEARLARPPAAAAHLLTEENMRKVEVLRRWAATRGRSLLELAFSWLLAHREISSVIAGATRPDQLIANVAACDWCLGDRDFDEVNALLEAHCVGKLALTSPAA